MYLILVHIFSIRLSGSPFFSLRLSLNLNVMRLFNGDWKVLSTFCSEFKTVFFMVKLIDISRKISGM